MECNEVVFAFRFGVDFVFDAGFRFSVLADIVESLCPWIGRTILSAVTPRVVIFDPRRQRRRYGQRDASNTVL